MFYSTSLKSFHLFFSRRDLSRDLFIHWQRNHDAFARPRVDNRYLPASRFVESHAAIRPFLAFAFSIYYDVLPNNSPSRIEPSLCGICAKWNISGAEQVERHES